MTSSPLLTKIFKWGTGGFLTIVLLIVAGGAWIYYSISIKEMPTCLSLEASDSLEVSNKVLFELRSIAESMGLKAKRNVYEWESTRTKMSYYPSGLEPGKYRIFICSKNSDPKEWQAVAKKVEPVLQRYATTVNAWLQRNNRDFQCDPNCVTDVSFPLDFEKLNRTLLAPDGS